MKKRPGSRPSRHVQRSNSVRSSRQRHLQIEKLEQRQLLAKVIWDGGGDGSSWHDRLNWQGDSTPISGDDAEINAPTSRITVSQNIDLKSLAANSALLISNNAVLTLRGISSVSKEFTLSAGSSFIVTGSGATFSAIASSFISGANLTASAGGVIQLPLATVYEHVGTSNDLQRRILADGSGSRIELNGLKEITGGTQYNSKIDISAVNSGSILFPNLTTIFDPEVGDLRLRQINLNARGISSVISFPKLESAIDQSSDSVWSVSDGATLNTPMLKYLGGTEISVDSAAIPMPELTTIFDSTVRLDKNASLTAAKLSVVNGSNLLASGGSVLSLPAVKSYFHASDQNDRHRTFRAKGANSRIELPNLESITGGTHTNSRIFVQAEGGGVVDLSKVKQIVDPVDGDTRYRSIDVSAKDPGSLVRLDELSYFSDESSYDFGWGLYSSLMVQAGGEVRIPKLTSTKGVNVDVDGTGTLVVGQFQRFTAGRVSIAGVDRTFSALVDATDTDFIVAGGQCLVASTRNLALWWPNPEYRRKSQCSAGVRYRWLKHLCQFRSGSHSPVGYLLQPRFHGQ